MNTKKQILLLFVLFLTFFTRCDKSTIKVEDRRWDFKYNESGLLTEVIRPDNKKIVYRYNDCGKLISVYSNDLKNTFRYNSLGFLNRITDNNGATVMERSHYGRMTKMIYPQGDELLYQYNEDGEVVSIDWKDHHFLRFFRDIMGRIIKLETPVGIFKMQHDYNKRFTQRIYPNGAFSQFRYNSDGRPLIIQHASSSGNILLKFQYFYNDAGLLERVSEWSCNGELEITYTYDLNNQLIEAKYSDGRIYSYQYDSNGNRLKKSSSSSTTTATYDARDQLNSLDGISVRHDPVGNVTNLGGSTFTYNSNNALLSDGIGNYRYNALGLRVKMSDKRGAVDFIHFINDIAYILAEKGETTKRYLWNEGQCLGEIEDNNRVLYFFEDHLGSIRCAMDNTGKIIGYAEYSPFGVPIKRIPGVRFGFAGEEQDEKGKVFLRARYYEPRIGRFLQRDPVAPQLMNSIIQNRYAYAANSPLNYKDRNGGYIDPVQQYREYLRIQQQLKEQQQLLNQTTQQHQYYEKVLIGGFGSNPQKYSKYLKVNGGQFDLVITLGTGSFPGDLMHSVPDYLGISSMHASNVFKQYEGARFGMVVTHSWAAPAFESFINNHPNSIKYDKVIHLGAPKSYSDDLRLGNKFVIAGDPVSLIPQLTTESRSDWLGLNRNDFIGFKWTFQFGPGSSDTKVYPGFPGLQSHSLDRYLTKQEIREEIESFKSPDNSQTRRLFPPFPPNGGGSGGSGMLETPNVGGVYLDKAVEVIGNLSGIEEVAFDPVTNRLVLIGSDKAQTKLPPFRIDDLAASFRTVFGEYTKEPGVTIDPNPQNPRADQMIVRFFGGMENTHFGYLLFEADREMKCLSLGQDNINRKPVKSNVKGYHNMLELGFSNLGGNYKKNLWSRFWLVPEQVIVQVSEDRKSISFPSTRIRVKTETMRWDNGKLIPAKGEKDKKAEYFAAHFTKYYDDYAKEFPVYQQLKNLTNLVALAKWLKATGVNAEFTWLKKYDKPYETPDKTPSLTVQEKHNSTKGDTISTQTVSIFGGTDLSVKNVYVKDDGTATTTYVKKALQAVESLPGINTAILSDKKNIKKRIVVLPTSQTHAAGAKIIRENEMKLITRAYCSFHNDSGMFGHSWVIDLPELHFNQPHKNKREYTQVGDNKVLIRNFHLNRPFGMVDVKFKTYDVDQQYRSIAFFPENNIGIRALYPDDEKGEFRVEYSEGKAEVFDVKGNLIRREKTPVDYLEYTYDKSSRLVSVTLVKQNKTSNRLKLVYNKNGKISSAETLENQISYTYDPRGDLVKIKTKGKTIEYTYNSSHLITGILINGKKEAIYEYDDLGRVLVLNEGKNKLQKREIKTINGTTEITETIKDKEVKRTYDAGGRLLHSMDTSGNSIKIDYYYEAETPKIIKYTDKFENLSKVEYSADNRRIKYIDSEKNQRLLFFDKFGRLEKIQDNNNVLLTRKFIMTKRGWLEETQTSRKIGQSFFNNKKQLMKYRLTSKLPQGGQIQIKSDYNIDGSFRYEQINGLYNEKREYENGKIKQINSDGEITHFKYGIKNRLKEIKFPTQKVSFKYNSKGGLNLIQLNKGKGQETFYYANGRLTGRKNIFGRVDSFLYDKAGNLVDIKKGKNQTWKITHSGKETTIFRNGKRYMKIIFDNYDRLIGIIE